MRMRVMRAVKVFLIGLRSIRVSFVIFLMASRYGRIKQIFAGCKMETPRHQHGIGRDHAPWLHVEKGEEGMALIEKMVKHFDPNQQLNPGYLIP